ncbi:MAG: PilZ domain-containing protein [Spirochaetales bacterium]|nr:PilZ domain-containing protein [Leptospiraceae bacterium]MCP5480931.1 PilZ domain-containing protein [Spirochaetales bacterium]MCP5485311.1 PilZ domain-containing protein [Spirochaetales bacterium]
MAKDKSLFNESLQVRDASQQKRKKARANVQLEGEFRINTDDQSHPCTVIDVGTGGLSLICRSTLYQGDRLTVRFRLGGRPISLSGAVVRANGKNIGIQYDPLDEEKLALIQQYIHTTFFDKDKKKA